MTFPAGMTMVSVHGRFDLPPSGGASGTAEFLSTGPLLGATDNSIIPPFVITATLDGTGQFTVSLPATNDPDWTPVGWAYLVRVTIGNGVNWVTGTLQLDYLAPTVELADLLQPNGAAAVGASYIPLSLLGKPNGVAQLDGSGNLAIPGVAITPASLGDITGLRRLTRTFTSDPAVAGVERWDLNYAVSVSTADLMRVYVNGVEVCWQNEIGFLRGTPNSHYKDDALVRGVARSDLAAQTGGAFELQESTRTYVTWKRDWFGKLWRGNGTAAPSQMADTLVLGPAAPVPAGTPVGTVIVRTVS